MLEVNNLSFEYRKGFPIFQNVSFKLKEGDVLSILGVNGAGKSTLLNCIANLFEPLEGKILVDGQNIKKMSLQQVARYIGYVPQTHNPAYAYNVIDFVVMGRTPYIGFFQSPSKEDYEIAFNALKEMGITHLANKPYTQISGGERQQATIARVMAQNPKIILLDEPTAHLDFGNQLRAIELVKQLSNMGFIVMMTTHMPDHVFYLGGLVGILDRNGKFTVGNTDETMTTEALSDLYNMNLDVVFMPTSGRNSCVPISPNM